MKNKIAVLLALGISISNIFSADIKIKGLYLGMPAQDAVEVLNKIFPKPQIPSRDDNVQKEYKLAKFSDGYVIIYSGVSGESNLDNPMAGEALNFFASFYPMITTDIDKKVDEISISPNVSNQLFNSESLDANEFVKKFMDAYNIPEFKPFEKDNEFLWKYTNSDGIEIYIGSDKSVLIKKAPKSQFN